MFTNKIRRSSGKINSIDKLVFTKKAQYPPSSGSVAKLDDPSMKFHEYPNQDTKQRNPDNPDPINAAPTDKYSTEDAVRIAQQLGIDWNTKQWTPEDAAQGMNIETEHVKGEFAVISSDEDVFKTAATHLEEDPQYYEKLEKYVEKKAESMPTSLEDARITKNPLSEEDDEGRYLMDNRTVKDELQKIREQERIKKIIP